ncbi:MAG: serine/threonine-protein kinase [Myxococcota bacterium]
MVVKTQESAERAQHEGVVVPTESLIARYELLGRLGRGGMAEVWLARATGLHDFEKILVLKRILRDKRDDPRFIGMLRDEARVTATLDHPNVVHTLDVGLEGEELFITMEYLHGENVKALLAAAREADEPMPLELAVQIAMGCAAGLHHAHEQTDSQGRPLNIVHRDVSPANVIVTHHSGVKLIDFGIATAKSRKEHTAVGMLKGKAAYMSPEQCRGKTLDRRSDVFALGIMMYEMTTMVRPFEGESHLAVMHQICNESPRPPSEIRRGYPAALERVVLRALERDPAQRHQSAFEVLEQLERVTRDCTLHALPGALARYLEHLFGPKPHPWLTARKQLIAEGRRDLETTDTSNKKHKLKADTSTVTQPKILVSGESAKGTSTETPGETTAAHVEAVPAGATGARGAVATEPAVPVLSEEELGLSPMVPRGNRSSAAIVGGSVAVAGLLVGVAAWYSAREPDPRPPPAAAITSIAAATKPTAAAPVEPLSPAAPTPAASSVEPPPPEAAPVDILVDDDEPEMIPAMPGKAAAPDRAPQARRILEEARTLASSNPRKAFGLARKALAIKRTPEGYSLLGMLSCRLGEPATARKAHRNLQGLRKSDLAAICSADGIELK